MPKPAAALPCASSANALIQKHTRQQHALERAQDYLETISTLINQHGEARATDLAKALGVSHVTVIRTVQRLQRDGYVTTLPYRSIFLTPAGQRLARSARARHETVLEFLIALGVPAEVAAVDAEGIEHHVSPQTLHAFQRFVSEAALRAKRKPRRLN